MDVSCPAEVCTTCTTGPSTPTSYTHRHEPLETQSLPTLRSVASELGIDCSTSSKLSKTGLARYLREVAGGELLKKPGVPANLLQSVFQSWPRLHHQREFERPYLDKRIQVLELGPFEVLLGGMERPMVCNVQFSPDMPLTQDGKPDVRIGRDLLRRSHYLFPEQMRGGLVDSVYKDAPRKGVDLRRVAAYGSVPNVSDGVRTDGEGRLYTDDKIRFGWAVVDGQVREEPPVPLSTTVDLVGDQMAARKAASRTEGGAAEGGAASPTAVGGKKAAKTWRGWK